MKKLSQWFSWFWHITDFRANVNPIVDARIKEMRSGLNIAEELQYNSRRGNIHALQHAAYCLDLPSYSVSLDEEKEKETKS